MNSKTNCAGQGCAERNGCRRYTQRIPEKWEEVTTSSGPMKFPIYGWGSFDLERGLFSSCMALIEDKA